jgi:hypothetical protein
MKPVQQRRQVGARWPALVVAACAVAAAIYLFTGGEEPRRAPAPAGLPVLVTPRVDALHQLDAGFTHAALDRPSTLTTPQSLLAAPRATGYRSFKSLACFNNEVAGLSATTRVVAYDPELWPDRDPADVCTYTPDAERQQLGAAMQQFCALAHARRLRCMVTPGTSLAGDRAVYAWQPGDTVQSVYLRSDIAGQAARYADISEVQAQSLQAQPRAYAGFVKQAHAQAVAANPRVTFLSGLSGQLAGQPPATADELYAAATAVEGEVAGFYFSMPAEHAATGLAFLKRLARRGR